MSAEYMKSLQEEAIRNTYNEMLKKNPEQKELLDKMLATRLKSIGVKP